MSESYGKHIQFKIIFSICRTFWTSLLQSEVSTRLKLNTYCL